jgi:hypothetical protein
MVFHRNRKAPFAALLRQALWDSPALQDTIVFDPEIEMVVLREMLVEDETGFRVCSQRPTLRL